MLTNREVLAVDPITNPIPNDGVTKVLEPRNEREWEVLRYELTHFVCEGEYQRGLERILSTYLSRLDQAEQPAVWVSGFYGSGKSHFVRVLEYLWRDVELPDKATARSLTNLPNNIRDLLKEISTAGRRGGGLWSAAGTLGAGAGSSVRLAFLGIIFRSAGVPEQYAPARFVLWLHQNNYYDAVKGGVEKRGKDWERELNNMYVSPILADSLLETYPGFAKTAAEARNLLKAQYPIRDDISDEEVLRTLQDVLELKSNTSGKFPCTLLIFDELQQFIGEDAGRALQVQTIVEACSSRFGSQLLFVATGQAALQRTTQLSKLQGRFTVLVTLSDTDVEQVVRRVVLQKKEDKKPPVRAMLDDARGEIDRHLAGTKIGPRPTDAADLVADYPLLPVRRRFWERFLRAADKSGMAGQLRTQLRIVHEAARAVAQDPLGKVVAADFIYDQLKSDMLQSSVLLRDIEVTIANLAKNGPDGELRSRLCALVFLINNLPREGVAETGVLATASTLADLLVDDLRTSSAPLRQKVPQLMQELVESGTLMLVGEEYRLQTRESAEWEADFRAHYSRLQADDSRIASDRSIELRNLIGETLKGLTFVQGTNKTPRKFEPYFDAELPTTEKGTVPVWIRDEWSVSERSVRDDAQREGTESPIVFVFIPKLNAEAVKVALAAKAAAQETLDSRPRGTTAEAVEARSAMEARQRVEDNRLKTLLAGLLNASHVYQGGGIEVNEGSFPASVKAAVEAALERLFPEFAMTDVPGWGTVLRRAGEGAADALTAINYGGDVDRHPACRKIREFVGSSGRRGNEIRRQFMGPPYGWPQDAVDGALLALMAGGFLRAINKGQPASVKGLSQSQIGVTDFFSEGVTISAGHRIAVRKLLADLGFQVKTGEEVQAVPLALERLAELAEVAGGDPPLPAPPSRDSLVELQALSGNEQFVAVHDRREALLKSYRAWTQARTLAEQRLPRWRLLEQFLHHARSLPVTQEVRPQVEAIRAGRTLLNDPDPVPPLLTRLTAGLRSALNTGHDRLTHDRQSQLTALAATDEWVNLPEADRETILTANALGPVTELRIGTEEDLLATLTNSPLSDWENKIAALPGRVAQAREEAARRLAPQSVRVQPRSATLRTAADVDEYLAQLRADIMQHIDQGKPVIL